MIHVYVSAVVTIRDFYGGRALSGAGLQVTLDGHGFRPEHRVNGVMLFLNMTRGTHSLEVRGIHYLDEGLSLEVPENGFNNYFLSMRPARNYPFVGKPCELIFSLGNEHGPAEGVRVHVAVPRGDEIKLVSDIEEGAARARVYRRGNEAGFPGEYLIADGKDSEICSLVGVESETACFAKPLINAHKRGKALTPCAAYTTDTKGAFTAFFKEQGLLNVFAGEMNYFGVKQLQPGINIYAAEVSGQGN